MSDFDSMVGPTGWLIWSATMEINDEESRHGLYVLCHDGFFFARYKKREKYHEALNKVMQKEHPRDALVLEGRDADARGTLLKRITRVEKARDDNQLEIGYRDKGKDKWEKVPCPDDLGFIMFDALRDRLEPDLKFAKERIATFRACLPMLCGFLMLWMFLAGCIAGAIDANRPPKPPQPGVTYEAKWARGFRTIGGALGIVPLLSIGVVLTAVLYAWMLYAIKHRPLKKVLREPYESGSAEEDDDRVSRRRRHEKGRREQPKSEPRERRSRRSD